MDEKELQEELLHAKLTYQDIEIPEQLNDYIHMGIRQGKRARMQGFYRKLSLIAACFLLITFVTSIRVSPAFAAYVSQFPGLEHIVKLITYDKGLQSALENDFIQPVGLFDEHDGILFKVDGIIVDESSMVLFYTLENKNKNGSSYESVDIGKFEFLDENGEPLKASFNYGLYHPQQDEQSNGLFHEKVNLTFAEGETILPDKLKVRLSLRDASHRFDKEMRVGEEREQSREDYLPSTWEVLVPIDKAKFADLKKTYSLNQTLTHQGQTLTFKKVTIYPTRIALEVDYDPKNTVKIFGYDDLKFVNENGEEWARIANGVTATKPSEYSDILYFQSNFFTTPEELYLEGSSLRMLPLEECQVLVDLNQGQILKGPEGLALKEVSPTKGHGIRLVTFSLNVEAQDENHGFGVFAFNFQDTLGNSYEMEGQGNHGPLSIDNIPQQEILLELPDKDYRSPLVFTINDYPNRIKQDFRFRVK